MKKLFGKNKGEEHNFWMSYTDLMSGFLIVFIVASLIANKTTYNPKTHKVIPIEQESYDPKKFVLFDKKKNPNVRVDNNGKIIIEDTEWEKLQEIIQSIKNIDPTYFEYNPEYKRHTLKGINVSFKIGSSALKKDISESDRKKLKDAGKKIKEFVDNAVSKNSKIKYLLIIEGQSSYDKNYKYSQDQWENNDVLSYKRALELKNFWEENKIIKNNSHCEIIISGSGQNSTFREHPEEIKKDGKNIGNPANQRFVIHIMPKIGDLEK